MGVYFLNGRRISNASNTNLYQQWTPFQGYPKNFSVWNVSYTADREYMSSPLTRSLNGYERSNPSGIRLKVSLQLENTNSSQSNDIANMISLCSSQYDRVIVNTFSKSIVSTNATSSLIETNLSSTYPNNLSNAYQGAFCRSGSVTLLCTGYFTNATTKRFRLNANVLNVGGFGTDQPMEVLLLPSVPTVIGVSTDQTNTNMSFYNLSGSTFTLQRELTVGNQILSMDLSSVDRFQNIPSNFVL